MKPKANFFLDVEINKNLKFEEQKARAIIFCYIV